MSRFGFKPLSGDNEAPLTFIDTKYLLFNCSLGLLLHLFTITTG